MTKRLFIFAGYDKFQRVDDTLLYYLNSLSALGDIVFNMDNDLPDDELAKITAIPHVLYAAAHRHGEYDFGSYKRGYIWARDNKILDKYDWVYLVNDSVFGPFVPLEPLIEKMENSGADFTGMLYFKHEVTECLQSWFLGLNKQIVQSDIFDNFISSITAQPDKHTVVFKYEMRLSRLLQTYGYTRFGLYQQIYTDIIYDNPVNLLIRGFPFLKKIAKYNLERITWLYPFADQPVIDDVIKYVDRYQLYRPDIQTKYIKTARLTVFGIPIFSIANRRDSYKIYLFDLIPICKYYDRRLLKPKE